MVLSCFPSQWSKMQLYAENDETVDTIVILPGTYTENLSMVNYPRNLMIRSTYDPVINNESIIYSTIIQGADDVYDSVFYVEFCNESVSFQGLSISNGKGHFFMDDNCPDHWTKGGGICVISQYDNEHDVNINYCNIYNNYACWGGGVYGEYASFNITNSSIHNNALFFRHNLLPPDSHGGDSYNGPKVVEFTLQVAGQQYLRA